MATLKKFTPAEDFSTIDRDQELATVKELFQKLKGYAKQIMAFQAPPQQDSDSSVVAIVSSDSSYTESTPKPKKKYSLEEIEKLEKFGAEVTKHMKKAAILLS